MILLAGQLQVGAIAAWPELRWLAKLNPGFDLEPKEGQDVKKEGRLSWSFGSVRHYAEKC